MLVERPRKRRYSGLEGDTELISYDHSAYHISIHSFPDICTLYHYAYVYLHLISIKSIFLITGRLSVFHQTLKTLLSKSGHILIIYELSDRFSSSCSSKEPRPFKLFKDSNSLNSIFPCPSRSGIRLS